MENENYSQSQENGDFFSQMAVPNSTAVLTLGIISIIFSVCCCILPIVGIILGIIGLILGIKAARIYDDNPGDYSLKSFKNLNAGKICSIIGLAWGVLFLVYFTVGFITSWDTILEIIEEAKDGTLDPSKYMRY